MRLALLAGLILSFLLGFTAQAQIFRWLDYYPDSQLLSASIAYHGPAERKFSILPIFDENNRLVLTLAWEEDEDDWDGLVHARQEQFVTFHFDAGGETFYAHVLADDDELALTRIWTPEAPPENRNEYEPLLRLRRQAPFYYRQQAGQSS